MIAAILAAWVASLWRMSVLAIFTILGGLAFVLGIYLLYLLLQSV